MKQLIYLSFCAALLNTGCVSFSYFHPQNSAVVTVREKNEIQINAGYAATNKMQGAGLNAAWAPGTNSAVFLNLYSGGRSFVGESTRKRLDSATTVDAVYNIDGNAGSAELGYSWYAPLNEYFTFYAGAAAGFGRSQYSYTEFSQGLTATGSRSVSFSRLAAIPSLVFRSDYFEAGLMPKISYVNFNAINDNAPAAASSADGKYLHDLDYFRNQRSSLYFEPAFMIAVGYKSIKLNLTVNMNASVAQKEAVDVQNIMLGLQYRIPARTQ